MKILLVFFSYFLMSNAHTHDLKIGYINIDYVVTSSPQFIYANQEVVKGFKPKEEELLIISDRLKQLVEDFNKNKENNSKDINSKKIKEIAKLESTVKTKALTIKNQLKLKNQREIKKIQDTINSVIQQIAEDEKYDLILYQEVAYASKNINISDKISKKLRELFK